MKRDIKYINPLNIIKINNIITSRYLTRFQLNKNKKSIIDDLDTDDLDTDDLDKFIEKKTNSSKKNSSTKTRKSIPLTLKRKVWDHWIGEDIGKTKCLCCKLSEITQMSFHCGHIIALSKNGDTNCNNLKPICQSCNSSMGNMNMNIFIKKYGL